MLGTVTVPTSMADLTATGTLALVGVTFALVIATIRGSDQTRSDAQKQLDIMRQQLEASYRPLLIEVPRRPSLTPQDGQDRHEEPYKVQFEPNVHGEVDAYSVLVMLEGNAAYVSVPLRPWPRCHCP